MRGYEISFYLLFIVDYLKSTMFSFSFVEVGVENNF